MARIIIFCGTRDALNQYQDGGIPAMSRENADRCITNLWALEDYVLALGTGMVTGWRAPEGTFVVFDRSWNWPADDPMTIQARNRAS